jgi:hypothetical protein
VAAAAVLLAATVQGVPASADDENATFAIVADARYPYEEAPGYPGRGPAVPADAGVGPGSVALSVLLYNRTDSGLHEIKVTSRVVTNGHLDAIRCATSPIFPDDVALQGGVLQGAVPAFPTAPSPSSGAPAPAWSDPGLVLPAHSSLYCAVWVSGISDKVVSETVTSATATPVHSLYPSTYDVHTWAAAGKLREGFISPADEPVFVDGTAFIDSNENYVRDVDPADPKKTEPVLPGVRVTITGPDGKPVRRFHDSDVVNGPQVTDQDGHYAFPDVRPFSTFTLTLDLDSPGLAALGKERDADGAFRPDRRTWTQTVRTYGNVGAPWRFVPATRVYATSTAPRSAFAGQPLTITGRAQRADNGVARGPVVLESNSAGGNDDAWKKATAATNRYGILSASLTATRTNLYRFRYLGDDTTSESVSWPPSPVSVFTVPVELHMALAATARKGDQLTVTGTIKRGGKQFQTGHIVLESPNPNGGWIRWAEVRSTAGAMSATVTVTSSTSYRWRYVGDSTTSPGQTGMHPVVVTTR